MDTMFPYEYLPIHVTDRYHTFLVKGLTKTGKGLYKDDSNKSLGERTIEFITQFANDSKM
jgi:hypothetical protein